MFISEVRKANMSGDRYCSKCNSLIDDVYGCKCSPQSERKSLFSIFDSTKLTIPTDVSSSGCFVCNVVGKSNCLEHGHKWDLKQLFL